MSWYPLRESSAVWLYKHLENLRRGREDWQPMIRAVTYVESRDYPIPLSGVTSHASFGITSAPTHADSLDSPVHPELWIEWSPRMHSFKLSYRAPGERSRTSSERLCDELSFRDTIEPLIERLLREAPAHLKPKP